MCESLKRPKDKKEFDEILKVPTVDINLDGFSKEHAPLVNIDVDGVVFKTLLFPSDVKNLYVLLSAQGDMQNLGRYPIFQRVYWGRYFDGVVLYLDDPTRIKNDFSPCWYLGTPDDNYHEKISKLIQKVAQTYGIENENIFIIGSSNTGFPSCTCASIIDGAKAIALNPQVDICTYVKHNRLTDIFEQRMEFSLDDSRLNIIPILKNLNNSKVLLSFNRSSDIDEIQYQCLKVDMGIKEDACGLRQINDNVFLITYYADATVPHQAQPTESMNLFIIELLKKGYVSKADIIKCDAYIDDMKKYYQSKKNLFIAEKKLIGGKIGRIDIKNFGGTFNRLEVIDKSDVNCKIIEPAWLCNEEGRGAVIESEVGSLDLAVRVKGAGLVKIWLRGADIRIENGKSLPLVVRYKKFSINGISVLEKGVEVDCKNAFIITHAAEDDELISLHAEWESA